MGQLVARVQQEAGLILLVAAAVAAIAVALALWRVRTGTPRPQAASHSALDAAILGALAGVAILTLGAFIAAGPGPANLIPFRSLFDSLQLGDFWVEIVLVDLAGNFLLYFPLGLLVGLRLPRLRLWVWALLAVALTATIEIVQGVILNRSADITDVVMNGLGAVIGFAVARSVQRTARRTPAKTEAPQASLTSEPAPRLCP